MKIHDGAVALPDSNGEWKARFSSLCWDQREQKKIEGETEMESDFSNCLGRPLPKTSPCKTLDNLMRKTREKLNKRTEKQTEERINYFYAS